MPLDESKMREQIGGFLQKVLRGEFQLPVYAIHVWGYGNMICYHLGLDDSGDLKMIEVYKFLHEFADELTPPMNVMYVDANGKAAHVAIGESGEASEPTILH